MQTSVAAPGGGAPAGVHKAAGHDAIREVVESFLDAEDLNALVHSLPSSSLLHMMPWARDANTLLRCLLAATATLQAIIPQTLTGLV